MSATVTTRVNNADTFVPNPVIIKGEGRPVVYLHGAFGQEWPGFLDDLAETRKVYAPAHAGSLNVSDLEQLDGFFDLVLYYDDLFRELDLGKIDIIGHSFGGMVAAEYAAAFPDRVGKLILIDAMGLWNDKYPVEDHLLASPKRRAELRFLDASSGAAASVLATHEDPQKAQDAFIRQFLALASSSHFIHPIPERGLRKRLRRIKAETLVLWGKEDLLTPVAYAEDFHSAIQGSRVTLIAGAGHSPQIEQRAQVSEQVKSFLGT